MAQLEDIEKRMEELTLILKAYRTQNEQLTRNVAELRREVCAMRTFRDATTKHFDEMYDEFDTRLLNLGRSIDDAKYVWKVTE